MQRNNFFPLAFFLVRTSEGQRGSNCTPIFRLAAELHLLPACLAFDLRLPLTGGPDLSRPDVESGSERRPGVTCSQRSTFDLPWEKDRLWECVSRLCGLRVHMALHLRSYVRVCVCVSVCGCVCFILRGTFGPGILAVGVSG